MEKDNNNGGLIALVIVLFLLVLGLGGYIIYDKVLSSKETPNNNDISNTSNENTNVEEKLPEWAQYLLKQNITEITYETGLLIDDSCESPKIMTKEQLKNILIKMTSSKLRKYDMGGAGGPCWGGITIKYNGNQFKIFMGKIINVENNDNNILSLLEKEDYKYEEARYSDPWYVYEYDWDNSYIDELLK